MVRKKTFCTFCCDIGVVRFTVKFGMCMSIKIQNWQPGLCHQTEVTVFRRVAVDPLDTYIKISWHHYSHLIKNDMPSNTDVHWHVMVTLQASTQEFCQEAVRFGSTKWTSLEKCVGRKWTSMQYICRGLHNKGKPEQATSVTPRRRWRRIYGASNKTGRDVKTSARRGTVLKWQVNYWTTFTFVQMKC